MNQKKQDFSTNKHFHQEDGLWVPTRPMGLARCIAKAGYATRAQAEAMVRSGRVQVDGRVETDPSATVGPTSDILLDEQPLLVLPMRYYALNKPPRVVPAATDPGGRRMVSDFLPREVPGLRAAGRLDAFTCGLLLISNDNVWNDYAAGGSQLEKEYVIRVSGQVSDVEIGIIQAGMHLPNLGFIRPQSVNVEESSERFSVLRLVVTEGRNRQVRRIFNALRHDVELMRRVRIGPVKLGNLPVGKVRPLTRAEVEGIRFLATKKLPS